MMQMIYGNSIYAIQPEHINVTGLSGVDRKIIELCQAQGGWYGFYAQEIGWAEEEIEMLEGLFQVGAKFFFKSKYICRQFALSPAVGSAKFISMISEVKRLDQSEGVDELVMDNRDDRVVNEAAVPTVQPASWLEEEVQFFMPVK